ncbi:flavodoxin domain-containing protein [Geminisphaera colitermitum]|uniref:flavodoxin domain-containing protein n=1 Tax=Geminisphaera colitermitum TaxID=1148786 RepID=UPI0001964FF1|nr:flavodoxin family protein [Geminisphaera colitermitum]
MSNNLTIYYATMTGNAEMLARRAQDKAIADGWTVNLVNLADAKPDDLAANAPFAIFVVSTWGDGEPPSDAESFYGDLTSATVDLSALRHAVFGLGDRDYQYFNAFARNLDERLVALGSRPFLERAEADLDFEEAYTEWESRVFAALVEARQATASA